MMKTLMRSGVAALLVGSFALTALPASADGGVADALSATVVRDASIALKNAMNAPKPKKGLIAQVPPIAQQPVGGPAEVDLGGGSTNGCAPISRPLDLTTKDRFLLLNLEKLFAIKLHGGRVLPIVLTPTYVSRWSTVAASNGNSDVIPFEPNAPFGFPITGVHTRTAQVWSLGITVPFLKTPKMFGTFTVAPGYLVHTAGVNGVNKAQLYQIAYLEYTPNAR